MCIKVSPFLEQDWPGRTLIIQEIFVHMTQKKLFKICIRETVSLWLKKNIFSDKIHSLAAVGYYNTSEQFFKTIQKSV